MVSNANTQAKERIIPIAIDDTAAATPDRIWLTVPKSSDLKQGWQDITFAQLARAVDGVCWWLEDNFQGKEMSTVIGYIGVQDCRYPIVTAAVIKLGHKIMLPSPRNSLEGSVPVFEKTACKLLLCSEGCDKVTRTIEEALHDLSRLQIPSFDDLEKIGVDRGHFTGRYNLDTNESCLVLHSSGSTGLPKPVYLKNSTLGTVWSTAAAQYPNGRESIWKVFNQQRPMFSMLPFFHAMGVVSMVRCTVDKAPLIIHPADRPPNPESVLEIIRQTRPYIVFLAPSIIEEIAKLPEGIETLSCVEYVFYGGASLNIAAGNKVSEYTTLVNGLGSTETWCIPLQQHEDKSDWRWFDFAPGSGAQMEHEDDNLFELVIKREKDIAHQGTFYNFPELQEWRTKDLYAQHPTKPGLFAFAGRKDDVIVLSSGEKFNPIDFEKTVETDATIGGALVVGEKRFQAGLIIEPLWDKVPKDENDAHLIDLFWPIVKRANESVPTHAQVWKSKIRVADREKPFKRAPKGSIMRRATNELYADEIENLLSKTELSPEIGTLEKGADSTTIRNFLRVICRTVLPDFNENVPDDTDFFALGTNSLQVLDLANTLKQAIGTDFAEVSARDVYAHPSLGALATFIWKSSSGNGMDQELASSQESEKTITNMVNKFTTGLPLNKTQPSTSPHKHTVILTGSTGSLGNYVLQYLIEDENVERIYCINRSDDAESRQRESFSSRKTDIDFSKVDFLKANFGQERFGLPQATYDDLAQKVDVFIPNAWPVDFNKSLRSYEDVHIGGIRRIVDFSLLSRYRAHIVFISSVAAVGNWSLIQSKVQNGEDRSLVPETIIDNPAVPLNQGYGESKYVSERILEYASQKSNIPVTIIRCGQLAGPSHGSSGMWNKHEWLPSIVSTSKAMGMIPESLDSSDTIDWVPIDLAAKVILELSMTEVADTTQTSLVNGDSYHPRTSLVNNEPPNNQNINNKIIENTTPNIYHLINPQHSKWADLIPSIQQHYSFSSSNKTQNQNQEIKKVSLREWLSTLRQKTTGKNPSKSTADLAKEYPALKLLDFYTGLLPTENQTEIKGDEDGLKQRQRFMLDTKLAQAQSPILRNMREIDGVLMGRWLDQWRF